MYICDCCGARFKEPRLIDGGLQDPRFPDENGNRVWYAECPECGSSDYSEAKGECIICQEPISEYEGICNDCKSMINQDINALAGKYGITPDDLSFALQEAGI